MLCEICNRAFNPYDTDLEFHIEKGGYKKGNYFQVSVIIICPIAPLLNTALLCTQRETFFSVHEYYLEIISIESTLEIIFCQRIDYLEAFLFDNLMRQ